MLKNILPFFYILTMITILSGCASNRPKVTVNQDNQITQNVVQSSNPSLPNKGSQDETRVQLVNYTNSNSAGDISIDNEDKLRGQAVDMTRWKLPEADTIEQNNSSYDLQMLLDLASRNNPTLRQAKLQISATLAQALQAGLYPNPSIAYLAENVGSEGTPGEFQGIEVEQRIVTARKLALSRQKYMQRAKVAEHMAVAQQFRVCNDIRVHYIRALAAQSLLNLHRELLKTAEDRLVTVKELYNMGQANNVDLRLTTADLRRHKLDLLIAENRVRQRFIKLSSLIGIELASRPIDGNLDSEHELIDFDTARQRIMSKSPEILAAYAKLQEDCITLEREKVEWVPDLIVGGGTGYNFEARNAVGNVMFKVDVPLYDRNQGTIRQAKADHCRQQQEIRRTEMMLLGRLADAYEQYISSLQQVRSYKEVILPEMKDAYKQALLSYKANRDEWPHVLDIYTRYTTRRIEQIQNLEDLRIAEVMIEGFLLHNGLQPGASPTPPGHIDSTPKPR